MKVRRNIKQYGNNNIQDKDPVGSVFHHSKEEGGSSGGEERMQKTEITDKSQRMSCVTYLIYYSSVAHSPHFMWRQEQWDLSYVWRKY